MFRKTAVLKVLEKSQKNFFSSVPLKRFELSNLPTYNYTEIWPIFKIAGSASVVESWFSEVTGEISALWISVKTHSYVPKVTRLKILRSALLNGVAC